MDANKLSSYLEKLVAERVMLSVMIWGAPGIGKSSVVSQVADNNDIQLVDLRLSQLAPTDLRGLPVPKEGRSYWYPPEFLPVEGKGILFLDEINMAPPVMQGMAQQLILDRKVGSYTVPEGWFVWAAGNRKQDRASVFDMPKPLTNRFLHLFIEPSNEAFRTYAYQNGLDADIIAFLAFRQSLTHCIDDNSEAWPSPRTWEMAHHLRHAGLSIEPAVGFGAADEFETFVEIMHDVPNLNAIINGKSKEQFPTEVSLRYATVVGLVAQSKNVDQCIHAFLWLVNATDAEWIQLFITDIFPKMQAEDLLEELKQEIIQHPELKKFLITYMKLLT